MTRSALFSIQPGFVVIQLPAENTVRGVYRKGWARYYRDSMAQRKSVSQKAVKKVPAAKKPITAPASRIGYRQAGVNIDEADRAVSSIRGMAQSTFTRAVLTDIGSFGGGYRLTGYRDPVLISSADGVGTKVQAGFHDRPSLHHRRRSGESLRQRYRRAGRVAALFSSTISPSGKLDARVAAEVISGVARGCREANGCALIGGETAEMPGLLCARRVRYCWISSWARWNASAC
jgi:hypothetical protein